MVRADAERIATRLSIEIEFDDQDHPEQFVDDCRLHAHGIELCYNGMQVGFIRFADASREKIMCVLDALAPRR